jgi:hypothetical protein
MKRFRTWIENTTAGIQIDEQLTSKSKAARVGRRLVEASMIIHAAQPIIAVLVVVALASVSAFAQTPGGSIFGGNDQTLGNGVREAMKWGRNLLFLLGIGGLMWAAFNYMTEKSWTKQAIGGVFCFGFSSVAALVYSFSQGTAVNLDTDLGN